MRKAKCIDVDMYFSIGETYSFESFDDHTVIYANPKPGDLFKMSFKYTNQRFSKNFLEINVHREQILNKILNEE